MNVDTEYSTARNLRAGPHGLGDPEDKSLRKVEKDVLILNKVREVAKERCMDLVIKFRECAKESGLLLPFRCRAENDAQMECIKKWFYDKELYEQMKEEYLEERGYYRLTGTPKVKRERRV